MGKPILSDLSLQLGPGSLTALVGPNGAGKTTLLYLVIGLLQPSAGAIVVAGRDPVTFSDEERQDVFGIMLQDAFFLNDTVRENILLGRRDEVDSRMRIPAIDCMISAFPHGLGTRLGEAGSMVSTGQRQLLSLARALVTNPKIVILDEPTSHLSGAMQQGVLEVIQNTKARQVTQLISTHSPDIACIADAVLYLTAENPIQYGPHRDLLAGNQCYRDFWETVRESSAQPFVMDKDN